MWTVWCEYYSAHVLLLHLHISIYEESALLILLYCVSVNIEKNKHPEKKIQKVCIFIVCLTASKS